DVDWSRIYEDAPAALLKPVDESGIFGGDDEFELELEALCAPGDIFELGRRVFHEAERSDDAIDRRRERHVSLAGGGWRVTPVSLRAQETGTRQNILAVVDSRSLALVAPASTGIVFVVIASKAEPEHVRSL